MQAQQFAAQWLVPFVAVVALGQAGSCAYQNATVRAPAPAVVTSGLRIQGSPAVVLRIPFQDARPDRARCGMKKSFDKESARVDCSADPGRWLAELLAEDLRQAGFRVYDTVAPAGESAVRIEGFMTQLFIEPDVASDYYVFFARSHYIPEADIAVRLVAQGDRFEAERRFYVKGWGDHMSGGLESNFQQALDGSVRAAVRNMSLAIAELVNLAPGFDTYACTAAPAQVTERK